MTLQAPSLVRAAGLWNSCETRAVRRGFNLS
jgi:hypothetical protein